MRPFNPSVAELAVTGTRLQQIVNAIMHRQACRYLSPLLIVYPGFIVLFAKRELRHIRGPVRVPQGAEPGFDPGRRKRGCPAAGFVMISLVLR